MFQRSNVDLPCDLLILLQVVPVKEIDGTVSQEIFTVLSIGVCV